MGSFSWPLTAWSPRLTDNSKLVSRPLLEIIDLREPSDVAQESLVETIFQ